MSHFAKVVDGKVTQVIVAEPDFFKTFVDSSPGAWIQTSYNTRGGKHYNAQGVEDTSAATPALRGNYAGIGYTYDAQNDVFYAPQPYASWTISAPTWTWTAPTPMPTDGKIYKWDEPTKAWVEVVKA
jgi:hypothetical protein